MQTIDYLDLLGNEYGWSDYKIAKRLMISRSNVSAYRNSGTQFGDDVAVRAAELLNIDPVSVLANIHAARAKDPAVRKVWERIAASAAMLLLSLNVLSYSPDVEANSENKNATVYRLCAINLLVPDSNVIILPYRNVRFCIGFPRPVT